MTAGVIHICMLKISIPQLELNVFTCLAMRMERPSLIYFTARDESLDQNACRLSVIYTSHTRFFFFDEIILKYRKNCLMHPLGMYMAAAFCILCESQMLHVCLCMYVCMYVCMYACMYVVFGAMREESASVFVVVAACL